jgi:hypothetical protein
MLSLIKTIIKNIFAYGKVEVYEKFVSFAILKQKFKQLNDIKSFKNRELMWDDCLQENSLLAKKICFIEFGVYQGYSIKYFCKKNTHPDSIFIGLDTFTGLPEQWNNAPKNTFNVEGSMPLVSDHRVTFIKGIFQDTIKELEERIIKINDYHLIVHYDADLYSSTIFTLAQIDRLKKNYIAIFDEFISHEIRALYNYMQSHYASVDFISKTKLSFFDSRPMQLVCKINPRKIN